MASVRSGVLCVLGEGGMALLLLVCFEAGFQVAQVSPKLNHIALE